MVTERDSSVIVAKQLFLREYNPMRTIENAMDKSINASVSRNDTYASHTKDWQRGMVKDFWSKQVIDISAKYATQVQTKETFDNDIMFLKRIMNETYGELFEGSNFKISHAQKSLSVYLKHLWCMRLSLVPPRCPVDRQILKVAGAPQNMIPWTEVDDIKIYRGHCNLLAQKANVEKFENVACWELVKFSPQ
ncbi:hypothetical protein [Dyadobacter bucti]|uniref:hypothetical protein n=1 Tax=Dyadobacter bucti TaxID=2572203 RepID=UPI001109748D|nr:hypothetical protein [Dyadobacter bucti]